MLRHPAFVIVFAASLAASTPPQYRVSTIAGVVPPTANPVAVQQYLPQVTAVAYDPNGTLYYASQAQVWRLNADGTDTLIAGQPVLAPASGPAGTTDGTALGTAFFGITSLAFDTQGNLYICDNQVWKITPSSQAISLFLPVDNQYFGFSVGVAADAAGNVYVNGYLYTTVADGETIAKYSTTSREWTFVYGVRFNGTYGSLAASSTALYLQSYPGISQYSFQTATESLLFPNVPNNASPAVGPDGMVYIATPTAILEGNPKTGATQTIAGTGSAGYTGDGGLATQAAVNLSILLNGGSRVAVNPVTGDVAFADSGNFVIRVVNASSHNIQTVAGLPHFAGDNGPAALARFDSSDWNIAAQLSSDSAGNLYFYDQNNYRIRKITPAGVITTVAGNGIQGSAGDGGKATQASITSLPAGGIAVDKSGDLYFVNGSTVRMVDTSGIIHTVAGGGASQAVTGTAAATSVALSGFVSGVALDASGNLYICQTNLDGGFKENGEILKVSGGNISIFAGSALVVTSIGVTAPDGAAAVGALLGSISSVTVDSSGLVYFSDSANGLIRMVNAQGNIVTVAGVMTNLFGGSAIQQGPAKSQQLAQPSALAFDTAGNLYFVNNSFYGPQVGFVDTSGTLTPIAGKVPTDGTNEVSGGDGGNSLAAGFAAILGMTVDPSGNVYVFDSGVTIRELSPYNPASPPPYLSPGGVVGAGASVPAVSAVSPNGDATIYGGNFGVTHTLAPSDLVNGQVPTTLAGVCASFGGVPAAILGVYPSQINVQVPTLPPGPVTVEVTLNCGKSNAISSNITTVVMQAASPEFFTFLPDAAAGRNPIAAINVLTGALIGAPGLLAGATFVPVKPGDIVEAFGTGWGATTPAFGLGVIPNAAGSLAASYTLTFAGTPVAASNILYAGVAPCCAGLYQVNFTVPAGTPSDNQPLVLTVGGVASPPNAFLTVQ